MANTSRAILWLSHFVPYPPKGGCFQRSYNLISRVGAAHELHLIAMRHKSGSHPESELGRARTELLRHCATVEFVDISKSTEPMAMAALALRCLLSGRPFNAMVYSSAEVRNRIRALRSHVSLDLAHYDTIGLAQYLDEVVGLPTVMTHHGAESHMVHRRIAREPSFAKRAFFGFEWKALERYEAAWCPKFSANVVMSDDDGALMSKTAPGTDYTTVGNGVDTAYFAPVALKGRRTIVFAGRLDQYSNRDGLMAFAREAWPSVRDTYPDATFDVIGNHPPQELVSMAQSDSRLRVHGFVPDIRPYFAEAGVALCPVRDGGGTRIKVLDALAMGVPLVATTIGCEGLDVRDGSHVLIADTSADFVRQIRRVFEDPRLAASLAREGRALVESRYSWDWQATELLRVYDRVIAGRDPGLASKSAS